MLDIIDHDRIREIRLARPPVNALTNDLLRALIDAMNAARSCEAIVITGQPGVFSAGLDVPAILGMDLPAMTELFNTLWHAQRAIALSPAPVVFGITGHCPAGGTVLAIHADYRVIDPATALRMGLVDEICEASQCVSRALDVARELCAMPREAMSRTRQMVREDLHELFGAPADADQLSREFAAIGAEMFSVPATRERLAKMFARKR
ncbi:MAG: enoyl-CoA hydratase [Steroidobacteraceae bacterium]|nr:enoyl-CoA hydratase [Steroidobacteraceae bacterium]